MLGDLESSCTLGTSCTFPQLPFCPSSAGGSGWQVTGSYNFLSSPQIYMQKGRETFSPSERGCWGRKGRARETHHPAETCSRTVAFSPSAAPSVGLQPIALVYASNKDPLTQLDMVCKGTRPRQPTYFSRFLQWDQVKRPMFNLQTMPEKNSKGGKKLKSPVVVVCNKTRKGPLN